MLVSVFEPSLKERQRWTVRAVGEKRRTRRLVRVTVRGCKRAKRS